MRTHEKSQLEVHALSSGDEGDSTMGCLAAGTLASDHALANMPSRGCRHRKGTHGAAGCERIRSRSWKYTLCRQGMRGTLPWDAWLLVLFTSGHTLALTPPRGRRHRKGTHGVAIRECTRGRCWKYTLCRQGMRGDSTMGCLAAGTLHLATHFLSCKQRTHSVANRTAKAVVPESTRLAVMG
jgi:hypothetical protein